MDFFTASTEFGTSLRKLGCTGIAIHFYVMDHMLLSAFAAAQRGKHELCYAHLRSTGGEEVNELRRTEWVLHMACKSHTCPLGVVWSLMPHSSTSIQEDAHIVIRSLVNTSHELHQKVSLFILGAVVYEEKDCDGDEVLVFGSFY